MPQGGALADRQSGRVTGARAWPHQVGVYSSGDGRTSWQYHGIVVPRGVAGGWDGGGIASPGAARNIEAR